MHLISEEAEYFPFPILRPGFETQSQHISTSIELGKRCVRHERKLYDLVMTFERICDEELMHFIWEEIKWLSTFAFRPRDLG